MITVLLIAVGAAIGAPARFIIDRYLNGSWPRGTLAVNLMGSLVLGVAVGYSLNTPSSSMAMLALVGTGFCGALTTFGGFAAQTVDLLQLGRMGTAGSTRAGVLYAIGSVIGCVSIAWLGLITGLHL
jgi:CrcB protein